MGKLRVPSVLFNFGLTPYQMQMASPTLGQHNREIYLDGLGYSQQDLDCLRQQNVI